MRYPLSYFASLAMAALVVLGARMGGVGYFLLPLLGFGIAPLIDRSVGISLWPSEQRIRNLSAGARAAFEIALLSGALAALALLGWGLWFVSTASLAPWEFVGLVLSVGMMTSYVGIVIAHECMHRENLFHRMLSRILLLAAAYPHYPVEHVYGHHHTYGLPGDPATARKGENFYAFILRAVFTGFASAFRLRPTEIVLLYAVLAVLVAAIYLTFGPAALALFLLQGGFAIVLLEGVQYVQHYGLARRRLPGGGYASPGPELSWDTSSIVTNTNLFNLARHSDHHSFSRRPYYKLRHSDRAPQLPYGYSTMFLIAALPPLWYRVMDPRVDAWQAKRRPDEPAAPGLETAS